MKIVLILLTTNLVGAPPRPKPEKIVAKPVQTEVYRNESGCGPFLDSLPKKKSDRLRSILKREDLTKKEIDEEIDKWVEAQDTATREKYDSFKRAMKVRILRLKLRHELKMKGLSDEAKRLDEDIQEVIEDKDLTWPETLHEKKKLIRKASAKVLKELGINPEDVKPEEEEEEEPEEPPEYEEPAKFDYGNHNEESNFGGNEFDYDNANQNFNGGENEIRKPSPIKVKKPGKTKAKPPMNQDYHQGGDYDH